MTIFDYIGDIFQKKKGNLPLDEYVPFLVNRWLSFSSNPAAVAVNESTNVYTLDKNFHYKLLVSIFPKVNTPRINYIKKVKVTEEENSLPIALSKSMELSLREVKSLLEFQKQLT